MITTQHKLSLEPDQFALCFQTDAGVEAADLGQFLQRMSTVVGRKGIVIRVEAAHKGSLKVVLKAMEKEFKVAPIATASSLVAIAVVAISTAMRPDAPTISPLTKAGIALVEEGGVTSIEIVTETKQILLLNGEIAQNIQEHTTTPLAPAISNVGKEDMQRGSANRPARQLSDLSHNGILSGEVVEIDAVPYFRPDGHNYFIPVYVAPNQVSTTLEPGRYSNVLGEINFVNGQPEEITVHAAEHE